MRPWTGIGIAVLLAAAGCREAPREFPLAVGREWTCSVRTGFITRVETLRVTREVSAAGGQGFELGGALGTSRIGWREGTLYADRMSHAVFDPPLPLLVSGQDQARREWSGTVHATGASAPARATLEQTLEEREEAGADARTVKATLTLRSGGRTVELATWYRAGYGPVLQEQRIDGQLLLALEAVGAP